MKIFLKKKNWKKDNLNKKYLNLNDIFTFITNLLNKKFSMRTMTENEMYDY